MGEVAAAGRGTFAPITFLIDIRSRVAGLAVLLEQRIARLGGGRGGTGSGGGVWWHSLGGATGRVCDGVSIVHGPAAGCCVRHHNGAPHTLGAGVLGGGTCRRGEGEERGACARGGGERCIQFKLKLQIANCLQLSVSPIQIVWGFPPYVLYGQTFVNFQKLTGGGKSTLLSVCYCIV